MCGQKVSFSDHSCNNVLGAIADSRYIGQRDITDRDVSGVVVSLNDFPLITTPLVFW